MRRLPVLLTVLAALAAGAASAQSPTLTPERLWALDRVGGPAVSPDGQTVVYTVTTPDVPGNRTTTHLWRVPAAGGAPVRLTDHLGRNAEPLWHPSGELAYVSNEGGARGLWMMRPDGTHRRAVTGLPADAANVGFAPTGDYVSFTRPVRLDPSPADRYPDLPAAEVRVYDDLMYRHWQDWADGTYSHLFVAPFDAAAARVGEAVDVMPGQRVHTPLMPFGGAEQIAWHPDGRRIAYTAKPLQGTASATSTNADVFLYSVRTGETANLTAPNPGYDIEPAFSPDGRRLAWASMARDGYEADRNRLFVLDLETGERQELTRGFDRNANHPTWLPGGQALVFSTETGGTVQLYTIAREGGVPRPVTVGIHNVGAFSVGGTAAAPTLVAERQSMVVPTDLYRVDMASGAMTALTTTGADAVADLALPTVHERLVPTSDGQPMLVWEVRPPGFDPSRQYPAVLYMQGGPQSALTQFFSYRWNLHALAAQGYVVVAPNRRGMPGHGAAWNEQISGDWGGQAMTDLLTAIDAVAAEPYVDASRLAAIGASFGGYSAYWLAGHHEGRFQTFVAHAGIFNLESMYASTEELFFVEWDLGGPFWATPRPASYDRFSPHRFVDRWDTPMLITIGELDYRVPLTEGLQAYTALRRRGIEGRLVSFPGEGHWINRPQNSLVWHREVYSWLARFLRPDAPVAD